MTRASTRAALAAGTSPPVSQSPDLLAAVVEWDVGSWSPAVALWDHRVDLPRGEWKALDVGSRGGGLSLYLRLRGGQVTALDVSAPFCAAHEHLRHHGVADGVAFVQGDGTRLPFEDATFEVVAFKSVLGSVARSGGRLSQEQVVSEAFRVLKPGGWLLFAENARASILHRFLRRRFVPWGREWRYVSVAEMREWLEPFASFELHTCGFLAALGRTERSRGVLARCDRLIQPLVPRTARYVMYGYAQR